MKRTLLITVIAGVLICFAGTVYAQTVFTYRSAESAGDSRYDYDQDLLKLALDKTVDDYGEYTLKASPPMNFARALEVLRAGGLENPVFKVSASDEYMNVIDYVPFPVDLGIVGYRISFTSPEIKQKLASVTSLDQLKQYSMGQGAGWADIEILENAGFQVQTVGSYESLFKMVAANRFDLFPRGANEVLQEDKAHPDLTDLVVEDNLCLFYPLPRFFSTNKGNTTVLERVEAGLKKAYEDGSLRELWNQYYQESIDYVNLSERTIISIENPNIESIDPSYKQYFYQPE
ncbi:MAG: transporter substrate-binding domain-containing protein [Candidatus Marinimicrobia bacterium]|nr:transporter substrate-binding domain-containing protein [Candidatus Neomarinimicrobiota bacterium]MCF7829919.1 transporter substrate-binding domain-containing protein [Candidatus Neomarinimicrobiota bacterium]MCF7879118.1 transporter substrate-binding domain-containing protein [Candidatus Neomarinimicrobiota bacterium]